MSKFRSVAAALAIVCGAAITATAAASTITFQTRHSTASVGAGSASDVQSAIEALMAASPTTGYCDASPALWSGLNNQGQCSGGSANDIAFDITASFSVSAGEAGVWSFRVGPDFGLGGVLFIDGVAYDLTATDMWWNGSFADPLQTLTASVNLGAGNHQIEAYGFDHCCDGGQIAQFLAPNADWATFSVRDGHNPSQVPEPASGLLALGALAALRLASRRSTRGA